MLQVIQRMNVLRRSIAAFLLIAWLPAVSACPLTCTFPQGAADCCEMDSTAPGSSDTCADCGTFENGVPLWVHVAMPAPDRKTDAWLTTLLSALAEDAANKPLLFGHSAIPPEPPLWQFISRTAQPARGPSFA